MALLGRDTLVTCTLPEGAFLLETFQGKEALGSTFSYKVTLLSHDPEIAPDSVLGQPMSVRIKLNNRAFRYFSGIVTYFAKIGVVARYTQYSVSLNPTLALLDYSRDCRIFFQSKAPEVACDLLSQHGAQVDRSRLRGEFRLREYCVQYRESCSNFIQRLFEEEGIYYFFKHDEDNHTMVLADSGTAHGPVQGNESVLYLPKKDKQAPEEEHFWRLSVAGALYPGKFTTLQNYDYTKNRPRSPKLQNKLSSKSQPGPDYDDYDNLGPLTSERDAENDASLRLESGCASNTMIEVEGNTMGLGVGDLVKLGRGVRDGEYTPFWSKGDFSKEYLITSATYAISVNRNETGPVASSDEPFRATFTLLDRQTQFRPRRHAFKPKIEGPQTAVVVGPAGDEIYTDKFGRVKVQFDWDRLGVNDQKSSCWVRVAQLWAGNNWGSIHIPRIGQEVIVEFLDGDPDRPIITGRVYNADNLPPYSLPDNKTQSGIKSRSSMSGSSSNFNELRFEDLKGSEEVHLQAEKDLTILVKNDEHLEVVHDLTKEVKNNETSTIHGNRTERVGKNESVSITGSRSVEVTNADTLTVKDSRSQSISRNDSLKAGKKILIEAGDEIVLKCGDATITMKKDGKITLTGSEITMNASGKINAKAVGDVIIKGSKIGGK